MYIICRCIYTYMYIGRYIYKKQMCVFVYIYIHIYIYIEGERYRELFGNLLLCWKNKWNMQTLTDLSTCSYTYLPISRSIDLSIDLSIYPSIYLSDRSTGLFIHLSLSVSGRPSYLSIDHCTYFSSCYLSTHPS